MLGIQVLDSVTQDYLSAPSPHPRAVSGDVPSSPPRALLSVQPQDLV